jgi:hypothetical protein
MSETIRALKFNEKILQIKILFLYLHREIKKPFRVSNKT